MILVILMFIIQIALTRLPLKSLILRKIFHEVKDLLGRKTKIINNKVLFYIYDDGTVEEIYSRLV